MTNTSYWCPPYSVDGGYKVGLHIMCGCWWNIIDTNKTIVCTVCFPSLTGHFAEEIEAFKELAATKRLEAEAICHLLNVASGTALAGTGG